MHVCKDQFGPFDKASQTLASRAQAEMLAVLQVGKLLEHISKQSQQHQPMLLRLAIVGLEALAQLPPQHVLGTEEHFAAKYRFLQNPEDLAILLAFAAKVMLYQPARPPRAAPAVAQASMCHTCKTC